MEISQVYLHLKILDEEITIIIKEMHKKQLCKVTTKFLFQDDTESKTFKPRHFGLFVTLVYVLTHRINSIKKTFIIMV